MGYVKRMLEDELEKKGLEKRKRTWTKKEILEVIEGAYKEYSDLFTIEFEVLAKQSTKKLKEHFLIGKGVDKHVDIELLLLITEDDF